MCPRFSFYNRTEHNRMGLQKLPYITAGVTNILYFQELVKLKTKQNDILKRRSLTGSQPANN